MKLLAWLAVALFALFTVAYLLADAGGVLRAADVATRLQALHRDPDTAAWAGPVVTGLLAADLVLPVPSSVVMTLAGYLLGPVEGACYAFTGAMISALLGFSLCRAFGRRAFARLVGARDAARVEALLDRYGAWAVLLSRSLPMLTEVVSCVAGIGGLSWSRFVTLSAAGTLPLCGTYAWIGSRAQGSTSGFGGAVLLAFLIPAAGFALLRHMERSRSRRAGATARGSGAEPPAQP